jgi:DNA-binding GntR family transcriptional regulator
LRQHVLEVLKQERDDVKAGPAGGHLHLRPRARRRARWDKAIAEHDDMISALSARDGRALRAILEAHLAGKRESVLAAFAAEQSAEAYD